VPRDPLRFLADELGFSEPRSYFVSRDSHITYTRDGDEVDVVWDGAPTPIVAIRASGREAVTWHLSPATVAEIFRTHPETLRGEFGALIEADARARKQLADG
jgi:hypothetical protein